MAVESVGQIGVDLVVNKNSFDKQMAGIAGLAKKAGAALAAAFAVKKIADFGASCVALGSDLAEVQNVVDSTFKTMSAQVNDFAKQAASSFGLSETMAKKFTGTFGAMARAFGFSEQAAYDMSTALTGLSGDVASFYNISQDEAYTKLKSVFTGETESLKDLGIVMTQTALDAYALANGYGKTTAKMTEAEKVALRYKFVQQQLTIASGDFIRTSDGWANQVRILTLQFDSFKAAIGQGLINVLTPVIKTVNLLMARLVKLGGIFQSFTERIMGKKASQNIASGMDAAADASAAVDGNISSAGKSAKQLTKALAGFDELNVLSSTDTNSSGGGTAGDGAFDIPTLVDPQDAEVAEGAFDRLFNQAKNLANLFKTGFRAGLGDDFDASLSRMQQHVQSIGDSLKSIFTSPEVTAAAANYAEVVTLNLGKITGSAASIGLSAAENLVGGIDGYLKNNGKRIQDYLVSMMGIHGRMTEISGNLSQALAGVFKSLRSKGAKSITSSIIGMFTNAFMGATEFVGRLAVDLWDVIASPFINNSGAISMALENTFAAVAPVFEDVKEAVDECFDTLLSVYDGSINPMLIAFRDGLTELGGTALDLYNTYIVPALSGISQQFGDFKNQYLSPLITKFGEFAGKVTGAVTAIWDKALKPFIDSFMRDWYPVVADAIKGVGDFFADVGAAIAETLSAVMDALGGLMDFITGIFTGDWELAWTGIKEFFAGIWDAMASVVDQIIHAIYNVIKNVLNLVSNFITNKLSVVKQAFTDKFNDIKSHVTNILNSVKQFVSNTMSSISSGISTALNRIKTGWGSAWTGMKNTVVGIFNAIWSAIKRVINSILGGVETMANGIVRGLNRAIDALNRISFSVPNWVPELGGMSFGFSVPSIPEISIPKLAQGGYVKANTPQLAMIGDNRHQGEVVAPEDKLQEMAASAARAVLQTAEAATTDRLDRIIGVLLELVELVASGRTMEVDGKVLAKTVQRLDREYYKATGNHLFAT